MRSRIECSAVDLIAFLRVHVSVHAGTKMRVCTCNFWLISTAVLAVVGGVLLGGIQMWLRDKNYVFTHESVASITNAAINSSSNGEGAGLQLRAVKFTPVLSTPSADHNAIFAMVEAALREQYPNHILPPSQKEWIFMNAGMGMDPHCTRVCL